MKLLTMTKALKKKCNLVNQNLENVQISEISKSSKNKHILLPINYLLVSNRRLKRSQIILICPFSRQIMTVVTRSWGNLNNSQTKKVSPKPKKKKSQRKTNSTPKEKKERMPTSNKRKIISSICMRILEYQSKNGDSFSNRKKTLVKYRKRELKEVQLKAYLKNTEARYGACSVNMSKSQGGMKGAFIRNSWKWITNMMSITFPKMCSELFLKVANSRNPLNMALINYSMFSKLMPVMITRLGMFKG